jgi:uncharacterized membrane protein YkoI
MRRRVLVALTVGFLAAGGGAVALAKDGGGSERSVARTADGQTFELRIDAELNARFGPRRVGGAKAAEIVTGQLGGGRVTRVELEEAAGRPIWEVKVIFSGAERKVAVDATSGRILAG